MFRHNGALWHVLSLLVLGLLLPLLFFIDQRTERLGLNGALVWLILLYCAFQASRPLVRNERRIMEMTFWLFTYVFMGIIPLVQISANRYAWPGTYDDPLITRSLLLTLLGMAFYHAGVRWGGRRMEGTPPSVFRPLRMSASAYMLIGFGATALSAALLVQSGSYRSLFLPRNSSYSEFAEKSQALIADQLIKVPIFVCLALGVILWKAGAFRTAGPKRMTALLLAGCLVLSNPISTARFWFGSVALTLAMLTAAWGKRSYLLWLAGYLALFIVVFPYADLFRNELDVSVEPVKISEVMETKGDYDAFQMLLNTVQYVDRSGDAHGRQLLGALLFWVPRSVWHDKPVGSGQHVAEAIGYDFTNLSSPLWAEAYINFGYAGVPILFALYGYLSGRLQSRFLEAVRCGYATRYHLLVPFLSAYQFFLLRGDLMNGIAYLSSFILFSLLFTWGGRPAAAKLPRTERAAPLGGGGPEPSP